MERLILDNISKSFKDNILFDGIKLQLEPGTITGIVGGNGSGKSVLFKIICGLMKPDTGTVMLGNKVLSKDFEYLPNTGIFIDSPGFISYYTGLENLKLLAGIKGDISEEEIKNWMRFLNLDPDLKTKVKNYSFGMKQKLGIVQAIMENQDIILLDEIFNGLDFKTQRDIKEAIVDLKSKNKIIMITSHNHEHLEELCDIIYLLEDKKLEILDDKAYEKYFGIIK
ncbi:ABC transporter ATP-binding protein [Lagierella sp.]|uniref:ABC transporter ATP-binding protein n=1 Tax=Lagierella sp. TaxID=2849657 RepID=UPI002617F56F|nr:ABC transporter ATP-binding protein [Lagierella sp.]